MQKFAVLGIGNAQVDLLRYLQGRYQVLACANSPESRGYPLCDRFAAVDIADAESILHFCQQEKVDFLYSIGSEAAMPTVSWVSEQLQLPHFVSQGTALACAKKNVLREKLQGVYGSLNFQLLQSPEEDLHLGFPLIIKPVDSQGQRGISVANNAREAREACSEAMVYSRSRLVVAEEYIEGPELSVNAFMRNGYPEVAVLSDRISWPQFSGGLIHKHRMPCSISETAHSRCIELVREVATELRIYNGPAYFQIKLQDEQPRLIEVTPRLDGCHLWRLIWHATGLDLLERTLRCLTGPEYLPVLEDMVTDRIIEDSWTLEFFCAPPGTAYDPERYQVHPGRVYVEHYYGKGQRVKELNSYMEKCGYQIYRA